MLKPINVEDWKIPKDYLAAGLGWMDDCHAEVLEHGAIFIGDEDVLSNTQIEIIDEHDDYSYVPYYYVRDVKAGKLNVNGFAILCYLRYNYNADSNIIAKAFFGCKGLKNEKIVRNTLITLEKGGYIDRLKAGRSKLIKIKARPIIISEEEYWQLEDWHDEHRVKMHNEWLRMLMAGSLNVNEFMILMALKGNSREFNPLSTSIAGCFDGVAGLQDRHVVGKIIAKLTDMALISYRLNTKTKKASLKINPVHGLTKVQQYVRNLA